MSGLLDSAQRSLHDMSNNEEGASGIDQAWQLTLSNGAGASDATRSQDLESGSKSLHRRSPQKANKKRRNGQPLWEPRTSQYRGVQWDRNGGRWRARIHTDRTKHIGYFQTEEEAAMAWDLAILRHYGEEDGQKRLNLGKKSLASFRQELDALMAADAQQRRYNDRLNSTSRQIVEHDSGAYDTLATVNNGPGTFPATDEAMRANSRAITRDQGETSLTNFPLSGRLEKEQTGLWYENQLEKDSILDSKRDSKGISVKGNILALADGKFGAQMSVDLGTFASCKDAEARYSTVVRLLVGLNGLQPDRLLTQHLPEEQNQSHINDEPLMGIKQTGNQSYVAELDVGGKAYELGPFPTHEDAFKAYERYSFLLQGIEAKLNSPTTFWSQWVTPAEHETLVNAVKVSRGVSQATNATAEDRLKTEAEEFKDRNSPQNISGINSLNRHQPQFPLFLPPQPPQYVMVHPPTANSHFSAAPAFSLPTKSVQVPQVLNIPQKIVLPANSVYLPTVATGASSITSVGYDLSGPLQSQQLAIAMQRICQPTAIPVGYNASGLNIATLEQCSAVEGLNTSTSTRATTAAEAAMAAASELEAQLAATKVVHPLHLANRLTHLSSQCQDVAFGSNCATIHHAGSSAQGGPDSNGNVQ
jgi:hypothetical protein